MFVSSFVIIMYGKVTIFSFSKMVVVGLAKELFVSLKLDRNASERVRISSARFAVAQRSVCSFVSQAKIAVERLTNQRSRIITRTRSKTWQLMEEKQEKIGRSKRRIRSEKMLWHKVWFFFFFFSWQNEQMKIVLLAIFCLFTYKTWPKLISFVGHMHTSHSHGIIGQGLVIKIGADANCTTKKLGSKIGPKFLGCFFQGLLEASFIFQGPKSGKNE